MQERVRALASAVKETLSDRIPGVRFHTPAAPDSSGGVVVFALPGADHGAVFQGAYETHRLGCASMGGAFAGIRISPHIYNTMDEVEWAVDAILAHA